MTTVLPDKMTNCNSRQLSIQNLRDGTKNTTTFQWFGDHSARSGLKNKDCGDAALIAWLVVPSRNKRLMPATLWLALRAMHCTASYNDGGGKQRVESPGPRGPSVPVSPIHPNVNLHDCIPFFGHLPSCRAIHPPRSVTTNQENLLRHRTSPQKPSYTTPPFCLPCLPFDY